MCSFYVAVHGKDSSSVRDAGTKGGIGRTAKVSDGDTLIASHVGEMDMARIREAEKVIDVVEAAYEKYILDEVCTQSAQNTARAYTTAQCMHTQPMWT